MPRVYIPCEGVHDFSSAEAFGELVYITDGSIGPFKIGRLARLIARKMRDSTADDWLLVTAHTNLILLCASILARKHGKLNLLIFGRKGYNPYNLSLDNLINLHNNARAKEA